MTRSSFERIAIYTAYAAFFLFIAGFVFKASGWELKHEYKTPLTKPCASCLIEFSECMQNVDDAFEKEEDADPQVYVNWKVSCAKRAATCGEDNKCGTKVVLDKETK